MDQRVTNLYEEYTKGRLDRRGFLKRLTVLAGGTAAALALLPELEGSDSMAQIIEESDARLVTAEVKFPGKTGEVRAYLTSAKGDEKRPGVIVVHENRGLQPHIKDVARRVALAGFLAIAPDALSPLGGTPEGVDEARGMIGKLDDEETLGNFLAAVEYLKTHPQSTGKVGVTGFCWGGRMANLLAVHSPDVQAAVPFYGSQPTAEDVHRIQASLLLHYAGLDERINRGIPAFEAALKEANVNYTLYMYEGAQHAFHNDTNPDRYNKEAAQLAWERTITFLKEQLKT